MSLGENWQIEMGSLFYYSTQTYLTYQVGKKYFGGKFHVYCAEEFDPPENPPSSNPSDLYRLYRSIVEADDRGNPKLSQARMSLKSVAQQKYTNDEITQQQRDAVYLLVDEANTSNFSPLVFVIDRDRVAHKGIMLVPFQERANPLEVSYIITDLQESDFEIMAFDRVRVAPQGIEDISLSQTSKVTSLSQADVAKLQTGDEDALRKLFDFLVPRVRLLAQEYSPSGSGSLEIEDLVQDILFTVFQNIDRTLQLGDPTKIENYFLTIARNKVTDYYRSRDRFYAPITTPFEFIQPSLEANAVEKDNQEKYVGLYEQIISRLSERQRLIFYLRLDGKSFEEIARMTSASLRTIYNDWSQIKTQLRLELSELYVEG